MQNNFNRINRPILSTNTLSGVAMLALLGCLVAPQISEEECENGETKTGVRFVSPMMGCVEPPAGVGYYEEDMGDMNDMSIDMEKDMNSFQDMEDVEMDLGVAKDMSNDMVADMEKDMPEMDKCDGENRVMVDKLLDILSKSKQRLLTSSTVMGNRFGQFEIQCGDQAVEEFSSGKSLNDINEEINSLDIETSNCDFFVTMSNGPFSNRYVLDGNLSYINNNVLTVIKQGPVASNGDVVVLPDTETIQEELMYDFDIKLLTTDGNSFELCEELSAKIEDEIK